MEIDRLTAEKYEKVCGAGGFLRSDDRGVIEVTGRDRADWLHNLVTHAVNTLSAGEGNYAFAVDVKGRTLFDLNILVLEDRLWLDVDARWLKDALDHLSKYIIVEEVTLADVSEEWTRFHFLGPATGELVDRLGFGNNFEALADMQHVAAAFEQSTLRLVKNNLGPVSRAEAYVPMSATDAFASLASRKAASLGVIALEAPLFEMIRMEAGTPKSVDDVDHAVIPPETLQAERGISYVKGCYLGQEVIERMRSRGSMARRWAGFKVSGDLPPPHNAPIFSGDKEIGRITSSCQSVSLNGILALGYIKTVLAEPDGRLAAKFDENTEVDVELVDLPVFK